MATLPRISITKTLYDFDKAVQTEWLVINGLGGYASSTILGINTRKYHGLLIAAFNPPVDRRVTLTKLDEEIRIKDKIYPLGANEFRQHITPQGYKFLQEFTLDPFPTYTYLVNNIKIRKTIFMPHGKNATVTLYEINNPCKEKVSFQILPLINCRHFYFVTNRHKQTLSFTQETNPNGTTIKLAHPQTTICLQSNMAKYLPSEDKWIEKIYYRIDSALGESCFDDNYQPGRFAINAIPFGETRFYIVAVASKDDKEAGAVLSLIDKGTTHVEKLYLQERKRQTELLARFQQTYRNVQLEDWLKWLVLVTDFFIVYRHSIKTKSVIAGYYWFEDWGRDALISLPGLTLVTKRYDDAREILLTFKHYCEGGIIPNRFPDRAGDQPIYNTVDATLWYFNAVLQFLKYTNDFDFVRKKLWTALCSIIEYHRKGTTYNIHVDKDGLVTHGSQLTWMDAVVNGKAVTPRDGKAVEIQALWYNALKTMELLADIFGEKEKQAEFLCMAEKARASFLEKFWNPAANCLFDVVKEEQKDGSLRPNQIIAVALDFSMLDKTKCEHIVEVVLQKLFGTYGLKTLAEEDPRYKGRYGGDWAHRNYAYHNGTVWTWLLGPFVTAFLKVKGYQKNWRSYAFQNFLKPLFEKQIFQAGLGTISEIFDGDAPHTPRGCIAQAWSVAEPLRTYVEDILLERPRYERQILKRTVRH